MNTNNPLLKRCVIYCRVSTKEQVEEGGSLATQEKICNEYAFKNGYIVGRVFIEKGESAKNADRTQLKELLAYCTTKKNEIAAVVIYKIDRLARNTDDYRQIRFVLKKSNVEIRSTSEFFEDTPAGRFQESILSSVAQFDNDVRTERTINGMRDAVREGRYVWGAPTGFDNGIVNGKPNLIPNQTAPLILKAFEEVAKDASPVLEIYRRLTKEGLVTRKGKALSPSHFYLLLSNELYMGWITGLGERNKGTFTPIITEELFKKVQLVLHKGNQKKVQYKKDCEDFPLRRFISHPSGKKLTGCWSKGRSKKYAYYRFHIPGSVYKKETVENAFKDFLNEFRLTKKQFLTLKDKIANSFQQSIQNENRNIELREKQNSALKEKRNILIQKNLDGVISDDILKEQLKFISDELFKHNSETIEPIEYSKATLERAINELKEYFISPSRAWENAPLPAKLKLQWFNFPQGVIFDGKICHTTNTSIIYNQIAGNSPYFSVNVPPKHTKYNHQDKHPKVSEVERTPKIPAYQTIADMTKGILELASILQHNETA